MIWSVALPAFLASVVEFVEALTIVLVIGSTINWKSSLLGAAAGFGALAVLISVFGTTIVLFVPLDVLRIVIGIILVLFGLQWLRKSVLRYSGLKERHDEARIFEKNRRKVEQLDEDRSRFNGFGFLTSFKSVLLEGLEVAFIVITFGSTAGTNKFSGIMSTAVGAACAFVVVAILGLAVQKPLTKLPENTLKYAVGIMLVTFGTFWTGEGLGIRWPLSDLFLFALIAFYLLASGALIFRLKNHGNAGDYREAALGENLKKHFLFRLLWGIFDFFCGDWTTLFGVAITVLLIVFIRGLSAPPVTGVICVAGIAASFFASLLLKQKDPAK